MSTKTFRFIVNVDLEFVSEEDAFNAVWDAIEKVDCVTDASGDG